MGTRHINPEGLHRSPAFSQAVVVEQPAKTIDVGGQNGVDADGKVVGPTVGEQSLQAFRNLATVLESEGASLANVVHWTIAVVDGQSFDEGADAFQQVWNPADPPPAISVDVVAGPSPGFLVEIAAVSVVWHTSGPRPRPRAGGPSNSTRQPPLSPGRSPLGGARVTLAFPLVRDRLRRAGQPVAVAEAVPPGPVAVRVKVASPLPGTQAVAEPDAGCAPVGTPGPARLALSAADASQASTTRR